MKLRIYTDGACSGNPGPGGWAMVFNKADSCQTYSGYELETTNNRMELMAVVEALKQIRKEEDELNVQGYDEVELYSDSAYVVNAINGHWIDNWKANGWKTKRGENVKNVDLWKELDATLLKSVKFIKVKGHSGNTFNELVDKLARDESVKAQTILRR